MYIYESCMGSLYTSDHELSYEERHCGQCGDTDWLVGFATTGEEAWNLLKYDTAIDGNGGWNYDYIREFILNNYGADIDDYDVGFDPYYEDGSVKFIWGVKSWDDLSGSDACLYTMNDVELDYLKDENKYLLSIETIFEFEKEEYKLNYLKRCLDSFTKFMVENGYNTEVKPHWWNVFGDGMNTHFDSIEECYVMFRMLVNSYCKL